MGWGRGIRVALVFVASVVACGGDDDGPAAGADAGPDIADPCDEGAVECDPNATCVADGSDAACVCDAGYTGDGLTCQPDECLLGTDDCDPAATCTDRPDGFDCTCEGAFVGDGRTCTGRYSAIEAGTGHACAIRVDGTLWCWGWNGESQVGGASRDGVIAPFQIGVEADWLAVSAGGSHTCGIRSPGTLWCWGNGYSGQLGTNTSDSISPRRVGNQADWIAVAAGGSHTCGIRADQLVRCWGSNGSGQLGSSTFATPVPTVIAPTGFEGDDLWVAVTAGYNHTCAIRTDEELFCWGSNQFLQLGIGSLPSPDQNRPRAVAGFGWSMVSAGGTHTCGVHTGFGDAEMRCWGSDARGQVGGHDDPDSDLQGTPRAVGGLDWASVSAGGESTCGLRLDGSRWCWGKNSLGQLGEGTQIDRPAPSAATGAVWSSVSAGDHFMCGIDEDGFASCWGANMGSYGIGSLGDGRARGWLPDLVPVDDGGDWVELASGSITCGRRSGGSLWCWGTPEPGGVGDGEAVWRATPTPIGDDVWQQVSIKHTVACGIRTGELYCWGYGWDGLLGEGEVTATSPQRIGEATDWSSVAVDSTIACGIRGIERTLWCWGRPPGVELTTTPVQVAAGQPTAEGWTAVAPSWSSVCGIRAGRLYCWGASTDPVSDQPVQIGTAADWTHVSSRTYQICAIRAGRLFCWGQYFNEEEPAPEPQPRQVGTLTDWRVVELGGLWTGCGVRAGGQLMCWPGGAFPAPEDMAAGRVFRPLIAPGHSALSVVDTGGQRWFAGDPVEMGDGSMWRSTPALIDD